MSHSWNCPDEYEARDRARRDAAMDVEYGWGDSRRSPFDCDEANEEYRRAYRREHSYREEQAEDERREAAARLRRQDEAQAEAAYWEQMERDRWSAADPT
jgi:hypothetical protein